MSDKPLDLRLVRDLRDGSITGERVGVIPSHEELCKAAGVDPDRYETTKVNPWTTSHGGKEKGDIIQVVNWLRRIAPIRAANGEPSGFTQDDLDSIVKEIRAKPRVPKVFYGRDPKGRFASIGLYDAHIRMLSWKRETGEDYDVEIQERVLLETGLALVDDADMRGCCEVIFPLGHDLFHADGPDPFTPSNKNLLDVDSRYQKGFRVALRVYKAFVERALESGMRVTFIVTPGNHDWTQTWFLGEVLAALYEGQDGVTVVNYPNPRKYIRRGQVLIMHTHGHLEKVNELPQIMAQEAAHELGEADAWSGTIWRECHLGHLHRQETIDLKGVVVRRLTAMCATDAYHHGKGYVSNLRAGVALIYDPEAGLLSIDFHPVRYK